MAPTLTIDRKIGMYGTCHRINWHVGDRDFAIAAYDAPAKKWSVSVLNEDGSETEYDVPFSGTSPEAIEHLEAIVSLAFRSEQAKAAPEVRKIPARYLQAGDCVGSGEIVVRVSAGIRTPRGKVEVTLEKDGSRRLAIWGASTVIGVRSAA